MYFAAVLRTNAAKPQRGAFHDVTSQLLLFSLVIKELV